MKNLAMLLSCGALALAIGCSDSGSTGGGSPPPTVMPNPDAMKTQMEEMQKNAPATDAGEKKEEAAEEKKEEAPAEKKEEAAEEKKEEAPAEKKEEAAEKKE